MLQAPCGEVVRAGQGCPGPVFGDSRQEEKHSDDKGMTGYETSNLMGTDNFYGIDITLHT